MNENIIGIIDDDYGFANSFIIYLNSHSHLPFQFRIFSDVASLVELIEQGTSVIKALFISEDFAADSTLLNLSTQLSIFVLTEETMISAQEDSNPSSKYIHIFKYQTPETILKDALSYIDYESSSYLSNSNNQLSSIIGIFSPLCNCYKTSLAFAYALQCCHNDSTLFISLDSFNSFPLFDLDFSRTTNTANFSDLIFHVRNSPSNIAKFLDSLILQSNGLSYILPPSLPEDIMNLSAEEFVLILKTLSSLLKYRYIVIDFGHNLNDILSCLSVCSSILMPTLPDEISIAKYGSFMHYLKSRSADTISERIKKLTLPINQCAAINSYYDLVSKSGLLSYAKSLRSNAYD